MTIDPRTLFAELLADLGDTEPTMRGILTPQSELGVTKVGVTAQFLDNAADYHNSYTNIEYFRTLIERALARLSASFQPAVILDIGSGSGNSVIPLLDRFPAAFVVATDISPQLLAILRDHLEAHPKYRDRYALVCMDASNDLYVRECFDLAVGAAILHHIIEPARVIRACASALRRGGVALFFEPFEMGHVLLNLAYADVVAEAGRRAEHGPGIGMLQRIVDDLTVRMRDKSDPIFLELDDKWLFTRSFFDAATRGGEWERFDIHPINSEVTPLTDQTRINLRLGIGADESALPDWAWERLRRYETAFSRHARRDIVFEGGIILKKRGTAPALTGPANLPDREFEPGLRLGSGYANSIDGWWWDPAAPGSGFFLSEKKGMLTVASCIYAEDGKPEWYSAGPAPMTIGQPWRAAADRQTLPSATTVSDGNAAGEQQFELLLTSARAIELQWDGRRSPLERQHQNALNSRTGLWVEDVANPAVAVAVECLPGCVFAALLDADGWCITIATARDAGNYSGDWLRFRRGQTRTGPWRAPDSDTVAGAQIGWIDSDCIVVRLPTGRRMAMRRFTLSASERGVSASRVYTR